MRIAIIGNNGQLRDAHIKKPEHLFAEAGVNLGNLAFWYAVSKHLMGTKHYYNWIFDPEEIRREYDVVVFVAANQMNSIHELDEDLCALARRLERCDKPLVVLGLGAQTEWFSDRLVLTAGSRRLLHVFSDRSRCIGVRGTYSASVAEDNGAKNVTVIGCPSHFINLTEVQLGSIIEQGLRSSDRYRLVLNLDLEERLKPVLMKCWSWLEEHNGFAIIQSPLEAIRIALKGARQVPEDTIEMYSRLLLGRDLDDKIKRSISTRFVSFFDAEAWMGFLRASSLSLGTRIHGNILAQQVGIPGVLIAHDARTRELGDTTLMPRVGVSDVERAASLVDLLNQVSFDGAAFDRRRGQLVLRYTSLLKEAGLPVSTDLLSFCANISEEINCV